MQVRFFNSIFVSLAGWAGPRVWKRFTISYRDLPPRSRGLPVWGFGAITFASLAQSRPAKHVSWPLLTIFLSARLPRAPLRLAEDTRRAEAMQRICRLATQVTM
jgi:hypothetical protein